MTNTTLRKTLKKKRGADFTEKRFSPSGERDRKSLLNLSYLFCPCEVVDGLWSFDPFRPPPTIVLQLSLFFSLCSGLIDGLGFLLFVLLYRRGLSTANRPPLASCFRTWLLLCIFVPITLVRSLRPAVMGRHLTR